jgi:hypothetical protein
LDYAENGLFHIWTGFDHILFLITLLLPAGLGAFRSELLRAKDLRATLIETTKTVSAFTLAHSLTLALVTFHVVSPPPKLVEIAIALSVMLTALNNLVPLFPDARWKLALAFGLIHGMGFAEVLRDLHLPLGPLIASLVGFNFGVEIGQMALVALIVPAAFLIRNSAFYRRVIFTGGSFASAVLAGLWMIDRAMDLHLLPF